jgi:hypothetical protein
MNRRPRTNHVWAMTSISVVVAMLCASNPDLAGAYDSVTEEMTRATDTSGSPDYNPPAPAPTSPSSATHDHLPIPVEPGDEYVPI